ncbi:MAG: class I SAM-dependent methyltransferase [Desulfobacterales bacterium]|nr:MAG: class I SAM-dependent methyltransferase [Desulfobacterales bacterium]
MAAKSAARREAFSKKMGEILNYGALNLAMAIGYRTGLFDVMDTFDAPQTVSRIAAKAGLNPRYVREWLGVMATGGIVELAPTADGRHLFLLPKAHADLITRRAGNANLGVYTQEIPLLTACAMEPVIRGFYTGDGVHYDHYPRFQAFISELANAKHREVLVDQFLPGVDGGRLIKRLIAGIRVCDLGCAEGVALILMAQAFPRSRFVGIDLSEAAIAEAQKEAQRQNIRNVNFLSMDAAGLRDHREFCDGFDYVTAFDAIHDQTRPLEALRGIHHILAPDGLFSMVDIAAETRLADNMNHPLGPFLYTVSLMHCLPVGLVDGGTGLGMMWGREKAVKMLRDAGFRQVEVLEIPHDPFNLHFFCRK